MPGTWYKEKGFSLELWAQVCPGWHEGSGWAGCDSEAGTSFVCESESVCVCAQVYVRRHMSVCARECMWMRVYQAGVFRGKMGLFGDSACLGA